MNEILTIIDRFTKKRNFSIYKTSKKTTGFELTNSGFGSFF